MYTQSQLTCDVRALGVRPDDVITVHTSLKAVGAIDAAGSTGADIFIDAMRAAVPEGLLLIPTHTFRNIREDGPVFNVRSTMPCIGTAPCVAVIRANRAVDAGETTCVRSLHVSQSVAAFGSGAREFVRADRLSHTRTPMTGSYGRLYDAGGKILLVGVDLTRNTFIHAVDEYIDATVYGSSVITVTDYDGASWAHEELITRGPAAATFNRYQTALEDAGALVHGHVGDAPAMLVDARGCFETVLKIRRGEENA